jgi:predicted phosphodiesterase
LVYFGGCATLAQIPLSTGRLIAVGDIHGCAAEFAELLNRLELRPRDQLVLLGDLINRGPDSPLVLDLARSAGAISLMGNHELRLLRSRRRGDTSLLRNGDDATIAALRPHDWDYLASMPLTHFHEALNVVFVHGGFLPGRRWDKQPAEVVTRIQVVDSNGRPRKRADSPDSPIWADLWHGPPFVVYGHTPRPTVHKLKWSLCIDTACVQGGWLTAYILPERRLVQVRAKRRYWTNP